MIPNNPNFTGDSVIEEPLVLLPEPPKAISGVESLTIGGDIIGGGNVSRKHLTYWSISASGYGSSASFDIMKYDYLLGWSFELSLEASFTDSSLITEISASFTDNNNLCIAYKDETGINNYWYDPRSSQYVTIPYGEGKTPKTFSDGGYYGIHPTSDVIFLYVKNSIIHMSNSSEYFANVYQSLPIEGNVGISDVYLTNTAKLQIVLTKIPLDSFNHIVEICQNETIWTTINKNNNAIKRC